MPVAQASCDSSGASTLRTTDGRLSRIYAAVPGEKPAAKGNAFLDDYAYLIHGLLTLHDATGEKRWLDEARVLTETVTRWHGDATRGGRPRLLFSAAKMRLGV